MTLLHANAAPETTAVARIWVFGCCCLVLWAAPVVELTQLPREAFDPPAPIRYLPRAVQLLIITPPYLYGIYYGAIAFAVLSAVGWGFRWTSLLGVTLFLLHQGIVRGFGFINHAELCLVFVSCVFAICAWAQWVDQRKHRHRSESDYSSYPLVGAVFVMTCFYMMTGCFRLANGRFDIFSSDAMDFFASSRGWAVTDYAFNWGRRIHEYPIMKWSLRLGFPIVTSVEALAPLCLVSRRFRALFVLVMIPFHVGTLLVMNIHFWENLLLYVLILDLNRWFAPKQVVGSGHPIIFFDSNQSAGASFVEWVIARDRTAIFRFATLEGTTASGRLPEHPTSHASDEHSLVLLDEAGIHSRSDAVLRVTRSLGGLWSITGGVLFVPRHLRDGVYDWMASRVRGKNIHPLHALEQNARFLD